MSTSNETNHVALSDLPRVGAAGLLPQGSPWACAPCATRFVTSEPSPDCPYCALPLAAPSGDGDLTVFAPEGVLPFKVPLGDASEAFESWIQGLGTLMTPSGFAENAKADRMVGVYLPYFQFRCKTTSDYEVTSVTWYGEGKNQTKREAGPFTGTLEHEFVDLLVCANTALPGDLIQKLEPWGLEDLQPFEGSLLGDHTIEARGDPQELLAAGEKRMRVDIENAILAEVGGQLLKVRKHEVNCAETRARAFLFPMWIVSYRFEDEPYRVLVNARTGEVTGTHPSTFWKMLLLVIGSIALVGAIVLLAVYLGSQHP